MMFFQFEVDATKTYHLVQALSVQDAARRAQQVRQQVAAVGDLDGEVGQPTEVARAVEVKVVALDVEAVEAGGCRRTRLSVLGGRRLRVGRSAWRLLVGAGSGRSGRLLLVVERLATSWTGRVLLEPGS